MIGSLERKGFAVEGVEVDETRPEAPYEASGISSRLKTQTHTHTLLLPLVPVRSYNQNPYLPILPPLPRRPFHPPYRTPHPPRPALVLLDDSIPTSRSKLDLPSLSRLQDREADDRLREESDGMDGRRSGFGRGCWRWGSREEQRKGRRGDERSSFGVSVRRVASSFFFTCPELLESYFNSFCSPLFRFLPAISVSTIPSKLSLQPTPPRVPNSFSPSLPPCLTVPLARSSPSMLQVHRLSSSLRQEASLERSVGICSRSGTRGRREVERREREELGNRLR